MSLATVRALKAVTDEVAAAKSARKPIVIETSTLPIADKERTAAAFARAGIADNSVLYVVEKAA